MEVPGAGAAVAGTAVAEQDEGEADSSSGEEPIPDNDRHGGKIIVEPADGKRGLLRFNIRPGNEKTI